MQPKYNSSGKTLYVSDLDGTLLNSRAELSEFSRTSLNSLIDQGVPFTFATARSLSSSSKILQGLQLKLPVIIYNGAFLVDPQSRKIIHSNFFDQELKDHIKEAMTGFGLYPLVYSFIDGEEKITWLANRDCPGIEGYIETRRGDPRLNPMDNPSELYRGKNFYYTYIGPLTELKAARDFFSADERFNTLFQRGIYEDQYWLEIMPREATKAKAIAKLQELLGSKTIVSFGDSVNDRSMFEISDQCYAVENAYQGLKDMATAVISSNSEDSVVRWLLDEFNRSPGAER